MAPLMGTYPLRKRLPVAYSAAIGRIITRWALIEFQIRRTTYLLVGCGPVVGRLAIREGSRVDQQLTLVQDLIRFHKLDSSKVNLDKLKQHLKEIERYRDRLAHGIWLTRKDTKFPVLQETKGNYPEHPGSATTYDARIHPKATAITPQNLRDLVQASERCSVHLHRLNADLRQQIASSLQKFAEQSKQGP